MTATATALRLVGKPLTYVLVLFLSIVANEFPERERGEKNFRKLFSINTFEDQEIGLGNINNKSNSSSSKAEDAVEVDGSGKK